MTNAWIFGIVLTTTLQTNWYPIPDTGKEVGIIVQKRTYLIDGEYVESKPKVLLNETLFRDPAPRIFQVPKYSIIYTNFTLEMTNLFNTNQFYYFELK